MSRVVAFVIAAMVAVPLAAGPAAATTRTAVAFVVPQTIDPTSFTLVSQGVPLNASPSQLSFGAGGAEIHSRIPGSTPGTWKDVIQVTVQFTLPDADVLATTGTDDPSFAAWTSEVSHAGDLWTIVFTAPDGGAPINDAFCISPGAGGAGTCIPSSALLRIFTFNDPTNSSIPGAVSFTATETGQDRAADVPVVSIGTSKSILWPPNGKMVPVTISGAVTNPLGDIDPTSATYSLVDEYGLLSGSGTVALLKQPDGSYQYSFQLPLQASRLGTDVDGRVYLITVRVAETDGQAVSATTMVTVPHDQR